MAAASVPCGPPRNNYHSLSLPQDKRSILFFFKRDEEKQEEEEEEETQRWAVL